MMHNLWTPEYQRLLERLKEEIMEGPTLSIPDPSRIFYIKTDWSKNGMEAVLLQLDESVKTIKAEVQEKASEKCEFEKSLEGMPLLPISFILRSMVSTMEKSRNIFLVEAATVRQAIGKFRKYLWGVDFTVLSNCSGRIRGQCKLIGTQVASQTVAVPISNMALTRKYDVGVQYAVTK